MNPVQFTPLIRPRLFGDRDLRPYMLNVIESNSGGSINDRAPHAPTVVLTDAFEFRCKELEYVCDRMIEVAEIKHLQVCGIQRRLGRRATVTLTFTLSATLAQFVLSKGYMVSGQSGVEFFTDDDVVAFNTNQFTVTASAKDVGTKYNVPAFTLTNLSQTRAYLSGVTNTEAAAGGLDAETIEETLLRGFRTIRRKRGTLISADDFEQYAKEILGLGSTAKAIGLLKPDRQSKAPGWVHIFALNPDGTQLTLAQQQQLAADMNNQIPVFIADGEEGEDKKSPTIASGVAVSSIELYPLEINVIATLESGKNPEVRANAIHNALVEFLKPGKLPLGETVVLYSLIAVVAPEVRDVQSINVNVTSYNEDTQEASVESFFGNIPLPYDWSAAFCLGTTMILFDPVTGGYTEWTFGGGGDVD
ncbi:MAG TPA: baseplate J/gp47 family protein [Allocoleopsis sp.]